MNISRDIIEKVTVAGIYDFRRLQIKRCGRLGLRAVLALDYCPSITRNVQVTHLADYLSGKTNQYLWNYTTIMETAVTTDWRTLCFFALIATLLQRVIEERTKKDSNSFRQFSYCTLQYPVSAVVCKNFSYTCVVSRFSA